MKLHYFEAVNTGSGGFNWGKFAVGQFSPEEWAWKSATTDDEGNVSPITVLANQGYWTRNWLWVADLATGEAAMFQPGGSARADLNRHKIHVCILFEAFLTWLWDQAQERDGKLSESDLEALAAAGPIEVVVPSGLYGYRRPGLTAVERLKYVTEFKIADMTIFPHEHLADFWTILRWDGDSEYYRTTDGKWILWSEIDLEDPIEQKLVAFTQEDALNEAQALLMEEYS